MAADYVFIDEWDVSTIIRLEDPREFEVEDIRQPPSVARCSE
jgi:hypothetical protein